jgi:hypothetical protein
MSSLYRDGAKQGTQTEGVTKPAKNHGTTKIFSFVEW